MFYTKILSRHPTHYPLRKSNKLRFDFKSLIRFGSNTICNDDYIEINSVESVNNSSNKLLMKKCFNNFNIKTAQWWTIENERLNGIYLSNENGSLCSLNDISFPVVVKNIFGSRGKGNYLFKNKSEFISWTNKKTSFNNYIVEKFYNYNREYRLHITENGCFYTCRKLIKNDIDKKNRWYRNSYNSVWLTEEHEKFDKPSNWEDIVKECIKAKDSIGIDICGFDVRVQSKLNKDGNIREYPDFIILESNSACSFGDRTLQEYIKELPIIILNKFNQKT
jgi:glutathione synthase/RimK-type ligase-like ATP-grasp enzyme